MTYWPVPPTQNSIHLVGDTQGINNDRKARVLADLANHAVPDVAHRVQVGDFTLFGQPAQFPAARAFMDAMGSGEWWAAVGNHDVEPNNPPANPNGGGLTAAQAASYMGMPGPNFVVDLGYAVLVVLYVNTNLQWAPEPPATSWLNTQLNAHADRTVLIVAHTQLLGANAGADMPPADDAAWKAVLADHPCVKAWIAGHSHYALNAINMTNRLTIGGRQVLTVDCGALHYTVPYTGRILLDRLWSPYLTVHEDRLEVRFRDHGAHQWVGANPTNDRLVTMPI